MSKIPVTSSEKKFGQELKGMEFMHNQYFKTSLH